MTATMTRPPDTTTARCETCSGVLIGSELDRTTCDHCGGRSRTPTASPREQVATLTGFKAQPDGPELDRIEAAYLEEGFGDVAAVPTQGVDGRSWAVSVFAATSPYQETP